MIAASGCRGKRYERIMEGDRNVRESRRGTNLFSLLSCW